MDAKHREFIRFCIVGAVCTALDTVIFYSLSTVVPYQVALVSGYIISLVFNYLLTIYWTFRSHFTVKNATGIILAHIFNLFVVRMGLMWFFTTFVQMSDNIAFIPTLAISVLTNFIIIRFIVRKFNN